MKDNRTIRAGSVLITGLFLLSTVVTLTGCQKRTGNEAIRVAEDSVWFDSATSETEDIYEGKPVDYRESEVLGAYRDGVVIGVKGQYKLPDDLDPEESAVDYQFYDLNYYDVNGKLINTVDVGNAISYRDNQTVQDIIVDDGGVYICRSDCSSAGELSYYLAGVDLQSGDIGEFEELPYTSMDVSSGSGWCFYEGSWINGDYLVSGYEDSGVLRFVICNNGMCKIVDLSTALPSANIMMITGCMKVSEKEIVLICSYSNVTFLSLDLESGEVRDSDEEYAWLDRLVSTERISSFDGVSYYTDQDGLKRINTASGQIEEVISFDCCNVNRSIMDGLSLFAVNGDRYIFAGGVSHPDSRDQFDIGETAAPVVVTLEKAATNPNAGKVIITAAAVGNSDIPFAICEAVRVFNDTNEDYYVRLTYDYDIRQNLDYSGAASEDETMDIYYRTATELNDRLAIDIMSGDGPDIILNAGDVRQILTEEHLVDLRSYVEGERGIDAGDLFANVIDAAMIDDALLFMPVSFGVSGLAVNTSDVREGQTGFTYDEYVEYVNEILGGTDPMVSTQQDALCTLFPYVIETCIQGDTVNFDNESFRSLCEYVKNNVPDDYIYNMDSDANETYSCLGSFLARHTYLSSGMTLLGYPSPDASGPVISVDTSIGISASASSEATAGAWEFIMTCLSDDIQKVIAGDYTNPISRNAFDAAAETTLENYNSSQVSLGLTMDDSIIASYRTVLESASVAEREDPAVLLVIREEIPPYFLDQKSLDEVLSVIDNRVALIVNER